MRNPMNIHQVSKVSLSPDLVDGIVLWTKNPLPMLDKINKLKQYAFYFQFTLNSYQTDVESNLPPKSDVLIPTFQKLSEKIGADRVIWRYDPVFLSEKYSISYHVEYFEKIARKLKDYTRKCTISFIDYYKNTVNNVKNLELVDITEDDKNLVARYFSEIAHRYGFEIDTCAEDIDLGKYGISHARCIDNRLLERISGVSINIDKDKYQRLECGCIRSIDIGLYNTCKNGCKYCYANYSHKTVERNIQKHDVNSPLLSGIVGSDDIITERKLKSNKTLQANLLNSE